MDARTLAPSEQIVQQWITAGTTIRPGARWTVSTHRVWAEHEVAGISEVESVPLERVRSTALLRFHQPGLLVVAAISLLLLLMVVYVATVTEEPGLIASKLGRMVRESGLRETFSVAQSGLIGGVAGYFLTRHVRLSIGTANHALSLRVPGGAAALTQALAFIQFVEAHASKRRGETRRRRGSALAAWTRDFVPPAPSSATVGGERAIPLTTWITLGSALAAWIIGYVSSASIGAPRTSSGTGDGSGRVAVFGSESRGEFGDRGFAASLPAPSEWGGMHLRRGRIAGINLTGAPPPPALQPPSDEMNETSVGILLEPDHITASSEYHVRSEVHPAAHAFDGNEGTAWNDGVPGNGRGEGIEASWDAAPNIQVVRFDTGWNHISPRYGDLFTANSHIRRVRVVFSDGTTLTRDVGEGERRIEFTGLNVVSRSVRIIADEVWEGVRYHDMCISEVEIRGTPNNETP